jgi:2'-5' RNA ligase
MAFASDGAGPRADGDRVNLYALVIYLPDPLGAFLDHLRLEMVPGCNPHAHVSVLPPRPLEGPKDAIDVARRAVSSYSPFEVELSKIEIFPVTDVIYISIEAGADQLRLMHRTLNQGALAFDEPFPYHPHVTLAQELPADQVEPLFELAARRWREFRGSRKFLANNTIFVQHECGDRWVDLAEGPLRAVPVR